MIAKLIERVNMILRIRHIEQQCFIEVIHKILRIPNYFDWFSET